MAEGEDMSYIKRTLPPDSVWALAATVLMLLSAVVRTAYFMLLPAQSLDPYRLCVHCALPVVCCVYMAVALLMRKNNLLPTLVPVYLGIVFFILKSFELAPWHAVLCCVLYAVYGVVYTLAVTGVLPNRLPLIILSGVPFVWRALIEDIFIFPPTDFVDFMPEISVLLIILGLFLVACGMRRGRMY